jgi:transcriptional regulator with XRE-family HTH domain
MRGDRLREIREQRHISQRELAARCGIGERQIWRYENGESEPSASHVAKIARELFISADYLLGLVHQATFSYGGETLDNLEQEIVSLLRQKTIHAALDAIDQLTMYIREMEVTDHTWARGKYNEPNIDSFD